MLSSSIFASTSASVNISLEPINVEKIALETKIDINDLMILLTMLELKGIIKQLPGEIYMKV